MPDEDTGRPQVPRRGPGRPSTPVPRERLIAIAKDAFSEFGFAGASMADIAERAGIRKSSLFHHFPTKEELYQETIASAVADIAAHVADALKSEAPFMQRLEELTLASQRSLGANRCTAKLLLREFVDARQVVNAVRDAAFQVLSGSAAFLEEGMRQGVIAKQDAKELAMTLAGVHVTYFAIAELSGQVTGAGDVFADGARDAHAKAIWAQVRLLVGARD